MSNIKKPVNALTDKNTIIPCFHYILKMMKVIDDFDKKYQFVKGFYFANKDDLPESDKTKVKVMMDLAKLQMEQHKGEK